MTGSHLCSGKSWLQRGWAGLFGNGSWGSSPASKDETGKSHGQAVVFSIMCHNVVEFRDNLVGPALNNPAMGQTQYKENLLAGEAKGIWRRVEADKVGTKKEKRGKGWQGTLGGWRENRRWRE